MKKLSLLSPAKLNLFFALINKRNDGFHEIASLYQTIDLFDVLHFSLSFSDSFSTDNPILPTDNTNLMIVALEKFREATGFTHPVSMSLEKNIPMQAGLGGGSSNAATTLWALNLLANHPLSTLELIDIAASFGSDISFFFSNGTAFCTGRGEKLEHQSLPRNFEGYLIMPSFGLSTPKVYQNVKHSDLNLHNPNELLENFTLPDKKPLFVNDLEKSAFSLDPRLAEIKQELINEGVFDQVCMTGSGTAFFATLSKDANDAEIPYKKIQNVQRNSHSWYGN